MKACFQIAKCNFASAKIRDNKKIRHFFYIIPHFFLRNQNIRRIICRMKKRTKRKKEVVQKGGPERWSRNEKCHFATYRQQWEYHFPRDC